ncbi:MAG: putative peptide zinc metalloprotease protein, partial [Gaiellales bacterium]|nr:putative peptide zinc metalloprotease protein [Gaiellales bacterium]
TGGSDRPELADGIELIGEFEGSGLKEPPLIARRADGQVIQLHQFLYTVAEQIDGRRDVSEIARRVTELIGRELSPDDLEYLIEEKLRPLGIVESPGDDVVPITGLDPMLALKLKTAVVPERAVSAVTTIFRPLFLPPVVLAVLAALGVLDYWLFVDHGVAQSVRQILLDPLLMLMVLGLVVLSAAFHECGHATATRYGGARPGVMGVGIYIVWPAFYTDITDSYRLGKAGRLRADLGGVYFNVIFILATGAAYLATGFEPLLIMIPLQHVEIVHQFLPFLRLDGYYIISDLTGVPDMFSRVKPVLASLIPGREMDPRVEELKPWARATVTAWVVILVPVLAVMFGLMAITSPRLIATAWSSLGTQWDAARNALNAGSYPRVVLAVVQALALVLPVAGLVATFWRVGVRVSRGYWTRTDGRPLLRGAGVAVAATMAAFVAYTWWPRDQYHPIQPYERGTLASAAHALRNGAGSDPTGGGIANQNHSQRTGSAGSHEGDATPPVPSGGTSDGTTDGTAGSTTTGSAPPLSPTDPAADTSTAGALTLTWTLPATGDVSEIVVRRGDGSACPAGPSSGTGVGGSSVRSSQVDTAISAGSTYCYSIFTLDSASTPSSPATVTATVPATDPSTSSGGTSSTGTSSTG